jgi:hypothetical protein
MKSKNKIKYRIKIQKLLQREDKDIEERSDHNEERVKKELQKIIKHNERSLLLKPIDTSKLIKK